MSEEYRRYKAELEALGRMLETANNSIDQVSESMARRAMLAYPNAADGTDLGAIHKELTDRVDRILDTMVKVQKALSDERAKAFSK